jgi:hypothetical protein
MTIFGDPGQVNLDIEDGMGTFSVFIGHTPIILEVVA